MKKLSRRHKNWLIRKSIKGNQGFNHRNNSLKVRQQYESFNLPNNARLRYTHLGATLTAPKNFNLSGDAEEVLVFLKVLRRVSSTGARLYVNFTKIEALSPMCALLLTSEIDRWRKYGKKRLRVVDREQWSSSVKNLLSQMGFNDLLNPADAFYSSPNDGPVRYLKLRSGTYGDAEVAERLSENIAMMAGTIEHSNLLHEGLTEAMINSKKWAYKASEPEEQKRWWVTGSYNQQSGTGIVMIYDHGVGIPETLPKSGFVEHYKTLLTHWGISEPDDAYWIKAAMTIGRTASGLKHRGKGLKDIQQFVLASRKGVLRVLSGRGEYILNQNGEEQSILHDNALNGTLIAWQIDTRMN